MFIDQLKNTRTALFDFALERSHRRRLVRACALGKMQRKAIIFRNLPADTLTRHTLSEVQIEALVAQFEEQVEEGFAWQIGGPGLRCQAISFC